MPEMSIRMTDINVGSVSSDFQIEFWINKIVCPVKVDISTLDIVASLMFCSLKCKMVFKYLPNNKNAELFKTTAFENSSLILYFICQF